MLNIVRLVAVNALPLLGVRLGGVIIIASTAGNNIFRSNLISFTCTALRPVNKLPIALASVRRSD